MEAPTATEDAGEQFQLSEAAKTICSEWAKCVVGASQPIVDELVKAGHSEAQAHMALANLYLEIAASIACVTARHILNREPRLGTWRAAADDAFGRHAFSKPA